jgi:formylglycine-generating enzyme required for sulfatase activity
MGADPQHILDGVETELIAGPKAREDTRLLSMHAIPRERLTVDDSEMYRSIEKGLRERKERRVGRNAILIGLMGLGVTFAAILVFGPDRHDGNTGEPTGQALVQVMIATGTPQTVENVPLPTNATPWITASPVTIPAETSGRHESNQWVWIPAGCFEMGASRAVSSYVRESEGPVHRVCLDEYWIHRTEVTVGGFSAFVEETGYRTVAERIGQALVFLDRGGGQYGWEYVDGASWQRPGGPSESPAADSMPVVQIDWEDAQAYCDWVGGRLPTEAEWEHAARGPSNALYPWGNDLPTGDLLNFCESNCPGGTGDAAHDDGYARSAPVASFPSNAFGLYDMAGNVWEWVADWNGPYASTSQDNPTGPQNGTDHVMRGGSWGYGAGAARSTYRFAPGDEPVETYGFRCAGP